MDKELIKTTFSIDETRGVLYQYIVFKKKKIITGDKIEDRIRVYDLGEKGNDFKFLTIIDTKSLKKKILKYLTTYKGF